MKKLLEKAKQLQKNLVTQDNVGTRLPINHWIQTNKAQRDTNSDNVQGKSHIEFLQEYCEWLSLEAIKEDSELMAKIEAQAREWDLEDDEDFNIDDFDDCDIIEFVEKADSNLVGYYVWYEYEDYLDCGCFFTREEAIAFAEANKHHVGDDYRIYVRHFWRNSEAETIVEIINQFVDNNS